MLIVIPIVGLAIVIVVVVSCSSLLSASDTISISSTAQPVSIVPAGSPSCSCTCSRHHASIVSHHLELSLLELLLVHHVVRVIKWSLIHLHLVGHLQNLSSLPSRKHHESILGLSDLLLNATVVATVSLSRDHLSTIAHGHTRVEHSHVIHHRVSPSSHLLIHSFY